MEAYKCQEFHSSGCTRGILARSVNSRFQFGKMAMGTRAWTVADENEDVAGNVLSRKDGDRV